ncbi:hypothetical protein AVEN_267156-1 [Araneus ventricosus]|uniref:Uncharacterized protein n=1 Tax=Araneus ventricosus TaxID=182803 RepID=A0A4Y2WPD2_ARAVE|nr:hypothetical protein AVEN_267156-1 [Araneus ventricosus]
MRVIGIQVERDFPCHTTQYQLPTITFPCALAKWSQFCFRFLFPDDVAEIIMSCIMNLLLLDDLVIESRARMTHSPDRIDQIPSQSHLPDLLEDIRKDAAHSTMHTAPAQEQPAVSADKAYAPPISVLTTQ